MTAQQMAEPHLVPIAKTKKGGIVVNDSGLMECPGKPKIIKTISKDVENLDDNDVVSTYISVDHTN